jgi:DNA-binding transcriptional MerR regulator
MDKSPQAFRTIREVADWLGVQAHVLRFWESKFTQIKPVKRAGGRRYYRPSDMRLVGGIKQLLHDDGLTISGVQKIIREEGIPHVSSLSQSLDDYVPSEEARMDTDILEHEPFTVVGGIEAEFFDDTPDAEAEEALPDLVTELDPVAQPEEIPEKIEAEVEQVVEPIAEPDFIPEPQIAPAPATTDDAPIPQVAASVTAQDNSQPKVLVSDLRLMAMQMGVLSADGRTKVAALLERMEALHARMSSGPRI